MTTRGIRAGKAYIEFSGDTSKLEAAMQRVSKQMKAFGESLNRIGAGVAAFGAALGGPLVASVMRFAKLGDVIHKSAARTGASAEAMSGLQKAAELSGATLTDVERAMKRSNEAIDDAIHKGGEAADAFERLGLSADELQKNEC